jgi:hypothetical protein
MKKTIIALIAFVVILTSFNIGALAAEDTEETSQNTDSIEITEESIPKTEQELFFEEMLPYALYAQNKSVLASVVLGVSAKETQYGKYTCGGLNYFGYKGSYKGHSCYTDTTEYYDGVNAESVPDAQFRAYSSMEESAMDFIDLMCSPRYDKVRMADNYHDAVHALKEAGYATSPTYEDGVTWIIEKYNLDKYDIYTQPTFESARGDRGGRVEVIQKMLIALGYDLGRWGADGIYGDYTQAAVTQFQEDHNLQSDGVGNMETMKAMAYWYNLLNTNGASVTAPLELTMASR